MYHYNVRRVIENFKIAPWKQTCVTEVQIFWISFTVLLTNLKLLKINLFLAAFVGSFCHFKRLAAKMLTFVFWKYIGDLKFMFYYKFMYLGWIFDGTLKDHCAAFNQRIDPIFLQKYIGTIMDPCAASNPRGSSYFSSKIFWYPNRPLCIVQSTGFILFFFKNILVP